LTKTHGAGVRGEFDHAQKFVGEGFKPSDFKIGIHHDVVFTLRAAFKRDGSVSESNYR
jgi:hypothetical protein